MDAAMKIAAQFGTKPDNSSISKLNQSDIVWTEQNQKASSSKKTLVDPVKPSKAVVEKPLP
jgi:hypothetical protein